MGGYSFGWVGSSKLPVHGGSGGGGEGKCDCVNDTDYFSGNIGNKGTNLTRQQCCTICKSTAGCGFAVLGGAAENPPFSCWLKRGLATKNRFGFNKGATVC